MKKPCCYKCYYRGTIPGSAHSKCLHPSVKDVTDDPLANILGILASVRRRQPFTDRASKLNIKAASHGVKSGWFNWPVNFDPVWLENCDGFKEKAGQEK